MIPAPLLEPLPIATWEPGWARDMEHPAVAGPSAHVVPLPDHSETWLTLSGLTVQLFAQNMKAQAALEA